eukprot:CAMPEP_0178420666 /NCGR_PEP_ID=MMETSP0689_2-20121128/26250_1 /TAXON_ID=160604 /ORGANISM="Amphidinium massartii, Strain CS-259" /LENGTH=118 /DNA_ID=CAMNT_0020042155 /DNA_START=44 /DNA_END=400 /DNA_ORIENTATION=+
MKATRYEEGSGGSPPADSAFEQSLGEDPETCHPVAVNTYDRLTRIHAEIQDQLAKQENLVRELLGEDDFDFIGVPQGPLATNVPLQPSLPRGDAATSKTPHKPGVTMDASTVIQEEFL